MEKYPMLRLVATGYKILAWLVTSIFLYLAYDEFKLMGFFYEGKLVFGYRYLLYAAGAFITLYACSEGIHVFMDIEKNTRKKD